MDLKNDTTEPSKDALTDALAAWREQVERDLKGVPFEKRLITRTPEGIALNPLYTRADLPAGLGEDERPGQGHLRRGARPATTRIPCLRLQSIRRADADSFNRALKSALMAGQDAVVVPGAAEAAGGSWSPSSLGEFSTALSEVELSAVPVHFPVDASSLPATALLLAHAEERGLAVASLTGSVAADPIAFAARTGEAPENWAATFDDVASSVRWARDSAPGLRTLAVDGCPWSDAGANAVQELGLVLAGVAEYARALDARGLGVNEMMPALLVRFGVGPRFFMEVAKFRSWRVLLAKLIVALEGDVGSAEKVLVQASTGSWNKTRLDVHVNLLRSTTESLSAVLGGVDALRIDPYDTVAGSVSPVAERVARNLHILIGEEFGFSEPVDAAGGSWYVENLTDQLARKAWTFFQEIEEQGGLRSALAQGWVQSQLRLTAKSRESDYAVRRAGLVGTNIFPNARDGIQPTANPGVFPVLTASASSATGDWSARLGMMVDGLRAGSEGPCLGHSLFGPTVSWERLPQFSAGAPFEALRVAAADLAASRGRPPTAFLARMGPVKQHKPRADFSTGFLSVAGFTMVGKAGYDDATSAAAAAIQSGADVVVICSTDETYPELVPALAGAIKAANDRIQIVLAGLPREEAVQKQFSEAGVDEFIHIRADLPDVLGRLLSRIGSNL